MHEGPVRQRLSWRRAKPTVADRIILRQAADHADLRRAITFHQLFSVLRVSWIGGEVVHKKAHHPRPGPVLWAENLKADVAEFLPRVMVRHEEWLRPRRPLRGEDFHGWRIGREVLRIGRIPEIAVGIWIGQSVVAGLLPWRGRGYIGWRHVLLFRVQEPHQTVERAVLHHHYNQVLDPIYHIVRHDAP